MKGLTVKPNNLIVMPADRLLNDYIWNAARYAIWRRTYINSLCEDIWRLIYGNLNKFDPARLRAFARDIKAEMSRLCENRWRNVKALQSYNDVINCDAYSLLTEYMYEHPETDAEATFFSIDCYRGTVEAYSYEGEDGWVWDGSGDDGLEGWSQLAKRFSPEDHFRVRTEYDGKEANEDCIQIYKRYRRYPCEPLRWAKRYSPVNGEWNVYVDPQYITKIKGPKTDIK